MRPRVDIKRVGMEERAQWEPLWKGYQAFYKVTLPDEVSDTTWRRFHDDADPVHLLGAYIDGKLVGIVHYIFHRSTWSVGGYCYLQDLYTDETVRGLGVGRALIQAVYREAEKGGANRVYWLTHETNYPGRALYDKLADNAGFIQYRKSV